MTRAFVLMTALPPTKGHLHLIQFAAELADHVTVLVCTQPFEPYPSQRYLSVVDAVDRMRSRWHRRADIDVRWLKRELKQDPASPGFWEMWDDIMQEHGFLPGDLCVSSEPYGATLAARLGGTFMPYDPERKLYYTKATQVREEPEKYFSDILPEFQRYLRLRVTFFGAESTGKTTLSHEISRVMNGHWLFEYARPYLETVGTDINVESMTGIWKGQAATQRHATDWPDKHLIIQDTDLFSTVGYWQQDHWKDMLGPAPDGLIKDALELQSDLYILTPSNIEFEEDPIRYGGNVRENTDEYWVDLCETYGLNYVMLSSPEFFNRMSTSMDLIRRAWVEQAATLAYDRKGL